MSKQELLDHIKDLYTAYIRGERSPQVAASDLMHIEGYVKNLKTDERKCPDEHIQELELFYNLLNGNIKFYEGYQVEDILTIKLDMDKAKSLRSLIGRTIRLLQE